MGKYDRFESRQEMKKSKRGINPIWRGIGCVMLILIPMMAYAAADVFSGVAPTITVNGSPILPYSPSMYGMYYPFRQWDFFQQIGILPQLLNFGFVPIIALFTVMFAVIGFMVFSLLYAVVYRMTGPPKYGPTDAPPPRRARRRPRR